MNEICIGFLHPGEMGISLAATAQNTGHSVYWVSDERSPETHRRAAKHHLIETQNMAELCHKCTLIVSVCPPHAASEVARQVVDCAWKGTYVDVNAISPQRARTIGQMMSEAGIIFVDGGIIGGPAWEPDRTWLYLSGRAGGRVAACFANGPLATKVIGDDIGKASALKMCFAANTKGTMALLGAILAAAEKLNVRQELERQWSLHDSMFARETIEKTIRVTKKAWRFSGEMQEIASTLEAAGLPSGFHRAAGDIYNRIAKFKGADPAPRIEDILEALLNPDGS